jgi:mRNA interferase RelE/StbE
MKYELLYTKSAVKDIKMLDTVSKKRLKKKLEDLSKNPYSKSRQLIDSKLGTYRYRIGNYRVIFDISKKSIVILRVRHRKEVYKK